MSLNIAPYPLKSCQRGGCQALYNGWHTRNCHPAIYTQYLWQHFGSTLEVESESNPANLLSYLTICLAVAITPHFFMRGVADNVLSEALAAN
jgi:hypothetical protein